MNKENITIFKQMSACVKREGKDIKDTGDQIVVAADVAVVVVVAMLRKLLTLPALTQGRQPRRLQNRFN